MLMTVESIIPLTLIGLPPNIHLPQFFHISKEVCGMFGVDDSLDLQLSNTALKSEVTHHQDF